MVLRQHRADRASGFTLIEVLIATAILAIALVGAIPMFMRSMSNNLEGSRLTEVTSRARAHLEALNSLPFNAAELTVPAGETVLETTDQYSRVSERWLDEAALPAGESPLYSRVTRVRQFGVSSINNVDLLFEDGEALDGGTAASLVHVKEIEVRMDIGPADTSNLLGVRKTVTLRLLKAF